MKNPSLQLILLDVSVSIADRKIETDCFVNPWVAISFSILILLIHFSTKNQLFTAKGLSIKSLCSSPLTFQKHLENFNIGFCKRGYPQKVVDAQIKRVFEKILDNL